MNNIPSESFMNNLPPDMHREINKHLSGEDLINMQLVSKHHKQYVDQTAINSVDKINFTIKNINFKIKTLDETISKTTKELKIYENNLNKLGNKNTNNNNSESSKDISNKINDLTNELFNLNNTKEELESTRYQLESTLKRELVFHEQRQINLQHVYDLFGGKENYLKLPIFNIKDLENTTHKDLDPITEIKSDHMKAQVMRGEDKHGRHFVLFRHEDFSRPQILYDGYARGVAQWFTTGPNVIGNKQHLAEFRDSSVKAENAQHIKKYLTDKHLI